MAGKEELALRLRNAYRGGPVAPLRDGLAPHDMQSAYDVQAINTRHWQVQGRRIVGRKIGLTSKSVQQQLGVDQPDCGVLFDDMQVADGGTLETSRLLQGKAEAEVALVLKRGLDNPSVVFHDVIAAVDYVVPAIEIVDSRIADWKITLADTIADNASSAFFVLGSTPHTLRSLDLWSCGMVLTVDGAVASVGAGAACLGHPLHGAVWLARTLAANGDPLRAGDVLLTGALGPMVTMVPNTRIRATIGGLGAVEFFHRGEI
jgi:2-keto-4-pentenoate hydratase